MSKQHREPQEPTVTEKSSRLDYIKASLTPQQTPRVESREKTTKNDKG